MTPLPPSRKPPDTESEQHVLIVALGAHTVDETRDLLISKGFKLDLAFPAIVVDPPSGRFVLRGTASPEVVEALASEPDLTIFPDLDISP